MNRDLAIEIAPFQVAEGVGQATLFEASERLEREFLSRADGYIGRFLVRKDAASWADIVFWESPDHAARAMQAVASSEACRAYFGCMAQADPAQPGDGVTLFRSLRTYGSIRL